MQNIKTLEAQFDKLSVNYEQVNNRVCSALFKVLQENYYSRCKGKKVLDIGNGGQCPSKLFTNDIVLTLNKFVGLDSNFSMLKRDETQYLRVAGNGLHLPFKDKAFDYVLWNEVIHHLGFFSVREQDFVLKQFINESLRVCANQVIIVEPFTSNWLESAERMAAKILGRMPTFVLSEATLDKNLNQAGIVRKEVITKTLSQLTSPFYWHIVIMDYEFFKLPAFLSPFKHVFFVISNNNPK